MPISMRRCLRCVVEMCFILECGAPMHEVLYVSMGLMHALYKRTLVLRRMCFLFSHVRQCKEKACRASVILWFTSSLSLICVPSIFTLSECIVVRDISAHSVLLMFIWRL